jgi:hypothetical protein
MMENKISLQDAKAQGVIMRLSHAHLSLTVIYNDFRESQSLTLNLEL